MGGNNFNLPARRQAAEPARQEKVQPVQKLPAQTVQTGTSEDREFQGIPAADEQVSDFPADETAETAEADRPPLSPAAVVAIILIVIPIALFFGWLSARFNFIFLDLLVNRDVKIGESFRAHKMLGNSYFLWSLAFSLIVIGVLAVLALLFAFAATMAKILLFLIVPVFVLLFLGLIVIGISIIDFVLPIMYQDKIKTMAACRKFLALKPSWRQLGLYLLLKIGLGIAAGIISFIVAIIVVLGAVIAGFIIGIPGGLLAGAVPFLKPLLIGAGILLLVTGILVLILLIGLVTLPIPIFFRSLALSYLYRLFPDYNLLGFSASESSS